MKQPLVQAVLALATVVAIGCNATGVAPLPTATPALIASPTGAAASIAGPAITTPMALRGTWTADIQGTTASSGVWLLIVSDSNVALQNPIGGDPFPLDPTALTETSAIFPAGADCPDQTTVTAGTYTVAVTAKSLTFTLVSDSCGDRSATLTSVPWARKS